MCILTHVIHQICVLVNIKLINTFSFVEYITYSWAVVALVCCISKKVVLGYDSPRNQLDSLDAIPEHRISIEKQKIQYNR